MERSSSGRRGVPQRRDSPSAAVRRGATAGARAGGGWLTLVCSPSCDHVSDGATSLGPGPIVHRPMLAGEHHLWVSRGSAWRTVDATLSSGQESSIAVDWNSPPPPSREPRLSPHIPQGYRNDRMRVAGIVLTSLASVTLVTGVVLFATGGSAGDGYNTGALVGLVALPPASVLFAAVGIPLWVVGALPPKGPTGVPSAAPTVSFGPLAPRGHQPPPWGGSLGWTF